MKKNLVYVMPVFFWLVIWQTASMIIGNRILLVSPVAVLSRFTEICFEEAFWFSILYTASRVMAGFLLALVFSIVFASIATQYKAFGNLLYPVVKAMQSIPVASVIILMLILFTSKVLAVLVAFSVSYPLLYLSLMDAIKRRKKDLLEMTQLFHISWGRRVRYFDIFEVLPTIRTACRNAVSMSWKAGIAAELIGIPKYSIGEHLQQAKLYLDTAELFSWTVVIVLLGILFERIIIQLLSCLEQRLLRF